MLTISLGEILLNKTNKIIVLKSLGFNILEVFCIGKHLTLRSIHKISTQIYIFVFLDKVTNISKY